MQILDIVGSGRDYSYTWPAGNEEIFEDWVEYQARGEEKEHTVRVGFATRPAYGTDRKRVVVWIDRAVQVEFLGADDFGSTGEVLSEIKVATGEGERMCRYREDPIPDRYAGLPLIGLKTRVGGTGVHDAWAVVSNISDHLTMIALAALRRGERKNKG